MIFKGITDTVLRPFECVVWDKLRARFRAFDGFKDDICDIRGVYRGDIVNFTDKPVQNAIPGDIVYIDNEFYCSARKS